MEKKKYCFIWVFGEGARSESREGSCGKELSINVLVVPWAVDKRCRVILVVGEPVVEGVGSKVALIVEIDVHPDEDAGSEVTEHESIDK
jgi:hypothetical protein